MRTGGTMQIPFTAADLRNRVGGIAGPHISDEDGDHLLNPNLRDIILKSKLREAAVLVPIVDRDGDATVILTQRTEKLKSHSGQVAFPGGVIDLDDPSPEHAALREAEEEIGLSPGKVDVIGRMPDYVAGSGYRIAPVFGIVEPDFQLTLNPDEVDEVFEVPLSFLMSPENHERHSRILNERERFFWVMPHNGHNIWGVTAGIIRTIYDRLYA